MRKYFTFILLLQLFSVFSSKLDPDVLTKKSTKVGGGFLSKFVGGGYHSRIVGGRIVGGLGGHRSPEYEYPFMVYFVAGPKDRLCGGTIISKRHVITAEHCLRTWVPDRYAFVIVGEHRVVFEDAFGPDDPETVFGKSMIRIKRFIRAWNQKDIAILELVRELEFTDRVQPACIAGKDSGDYAGWTAVVAGWGGTVGYEPGGQRGVDQKASNILKETSLEVLQPDSPLCIKAKGSTDDTFCSYNNGTDSCQGDSGGPVFVRQNDKHVLIGVVSFGKGCAAKGHAGVNVRVSYFEEWIRDNVGDICTSPPKDRPTTTTTTTTATVTTATTTTVTTTTTTTTTTTVTTTTTTTTTKTTATTTTTTTKTTATTTTTTTNI